MVRGFLTLVLIGSLYLIGDLIQRTLVVALVKLMPPNREAILDRWPAGIRRITIGILRHVGGAKINNVPPIPAEPGMLFVVNHQSLLDLAVVFEFIEGTYPKVISRRRYGRGIPLVSHMLRFWEHPLVDPGSHSEPQLVMLREVAAKGTHPLIVFPEGSRTRDGSIRPFRTAGLRAILPVRPWTVYLVVLDGFWQCAKFQDLVKKISSVRAEVRVAGRFSFSSTDEAEVDAFIASLHSRMCDTLEEMRQASQSAAAG